MVVPPPPMVPGSLKGPGGEAPEQVPLPVPLTKVQPMLFTVMVPPVDSPVGGDQSKSGVPGKPPASVRVQFESNVNVYMVAAPTRVVAITCGAVQAAADAPPSAARIRRRLGRAGTPNSVTWPVLRDRDR